MGWYGTWAQPLSYYAPCHFENAAPRRPRQQVKSCFDETNGSDFQEKKKVVKQVYRVKRDNRKDKSSDLSSSDTKLNVTTTTSVNIGKDVKQQVGDAQGAKSEPIELEVSKVERKLPIPKSEAQPSHPLGLPNWQMRKLQKLNTEELKGKNMAWVPKQSVQVHGKKDNEIKGVLGLRSCITDTPKLQCWDKQKCHMPGQSKQECLNNFCNRMATNRPSVTRMILRFHPGHWTLRNKTIPSVNTFTLYVTTKFCL
jgi:hypothetical protein